jgi:hypothetical protein
MTNIFSDMANYVGDWFAQKLASYMQDPIGRRYTILSDYYTGDHRPQLKRPSDLTKQDDNITQNFIGLVVDRTVSRLYSGGVTWKLPEGATKQQEYLDRVWDVNKKEIILYQNGLYGAVDGTWYFKINPDDIVDPYTGEYYPRLIPLNPRIVRIKTDPQDMNEVLEYKIEYTCREERNGWMVEVTHREITKHPYSETVDEYGNKQTQVLTTWVVETYEQVAPSQMQLISSVSWPYEFPPIIHCKNLPSLEGCYGDSEIDDVVNIQDKNNFTVSNTGKIIKYHASPNTILIGVTADQVKPVDNSPNAMYAIPNADAQAFNLEMQSDLASSRGHYNDLQKSIFSISREVDMSSMEANLGAITNFGLRVLYTDAINKTDTKRQLYGDAFKELNRRLLVLAGNEGEASNPGEVVWGDVMPENALEDIQVDKFALDAKLIDKETVYNTSYKKRYGVDWETVKANLEKQKASEPTPPVVVNNLNQPERMMENVQNNQDQIATSQADSYTTAR